MCQGCPSVPWGEFMKEVLGVYHVESFWEDMRKMRERMEVDNKKRIREAVERARAEIINNCYGGGTNDPQDFFHEFAPRDGRTALAQREEQ